MALAIDATSPAAVTSTSALTLTTAAFTPPAGSLLVMQAVLDTATVARTATATTVTGSTSAWTTVQNFTNGVTTPTTDGGLAFIGWATVTSSVSTTTRVTFTGSGISANDCAMKTYVLTGAANTAPIGATGTATLTTTPTDVSYTVTSAGSLGFLCLESFQGGSGQAITISNATVDTQPPSSAGRVAHQTTAATTAGATQTYTITIGATRYALAYAEVLPAIVNVPRPGNFLPFMH